MAVNLGTHRTTAKTMLHMWLFGFFPEYSFRQDEKQKPYTEGDYIFQEDRKKENTSMHWTKEEVEKLTIWIDAGINCKQISTMMDRNYKAVHAKAKRLNLI